MFEVDPFALASLFVALFTVLAVFWEIRGNHRLARRSASLNYLSEIESYELEMALDRQLVSIGVGSISDRRGVPLTGVECGDILRDSEACGLMNAMLNHLENIAIAREFGLVESAVWAQVHQGRLDWWAAMLENYIFQARLVYNDSGMWSAVLRRKEFADIMCTRSCGARKGEFVRPWCKTLCRELVRLRRP